MLLRKIPGFPFFLESLAKHFVMIKMGPELGVEMPGMHTLLVESQKFKGNNP